MKYWGSVTTSGTSFRQTCPLPYTPLVEGRKPVRIAVRDGLQPGAAQ